MIRVEDALKVILKNVEELNPEAVKLTDSLGRILALDIRSAADIPAFDNSAMDGYAARSQDVAGVSRSRPKVLEVIGDIRAGMVFKGALKEGEAVRIMTGAPVPKGADSVVMVEKTERCGKGKVTVFEEVRRGENIRRAGEDIKRGEAAIRSGICLTPAHMGLLASLGISYVKVTRRPKVAILATGDELVDIKASLKPGQLHSSNSYSLYGQVLDAGGVPVNLGIAKDDAGELMSRIKRGLDCDMILTSGGVSVGDYDLVKLVLAGMGTDIKFWKVAMRPGKPLVFGKIRGIPVFGLPGNPVSSMISFEGFVLPAISKMLGRKEMGGDEADALLEETVAKKNGLRYFLRAVTRWKNGRYVTRTTGPQGSGVLKSMALANSLIVLPEGLEKAEKGAKVKVKFLR